LLALAHNIRIVLVGTTHPGNIGATARAMKTMGLSELYLVRPKLYPCAEATARASGADDVLAGARVCQSLGEAIASCGLVFGASARLRSLPWPQLDAHESAQQLMLEAARAPVALLFGRESSGLTNEELERCHCLVTIPADPQYNSLNLAAAVQVLCYEIFMAAMTAPQMNHPDVPALATADQMEHFYVHLEQVLLASGFLNPENPKKLMRRLRRLFNRARPDSVEINILRGILHSLGGPYKPIKRRCDGVSNSDILDKVDYYSQD
jgi:tRNA (cytidine32/uridine32-2'-O)-methyltransferase